MCLLYLVFIIVLFFVVYKLIRTPKILDKLSPNITSGHFYVFHKIDKTLINSISVRNNSYTGYSYKNNNFILYYIHFVSLFY